MGDSCTSWGTHHGGSQVLRGGSTGTSGGLMYFMWAHVFVCVGVWGGTNNMHRLSLAGKRVSTLSP
jgi:hypothetical protein